MTKQITEKQSEPKRPICGCGQEMEKVYYEGRYEAFDYWWCPDITCDVINGFETEVSIEGRFAND